MIVIADIDQKNIALIGADTQEKHLYFGFRKNGELPVVFDNLTFGLSVSENSVVVQEENLPANGIVYESTDQDFIEFISLNAVRIGRPYSLTVWVENAGVRWEQQFDLLIPKGPQIYPSWSWSDELESWVAPVEYPNDGKYYEWNEQEQRWDEVNV